jgi:acyl-CoA synthetase (AMP-forming)/AMP-acid ligase II/aryl carrier-like protein
MHRLSSARAAAPGLSIRDLIAAAARRAPAASALLAADGTVLVYAELLARVDAVARDLRERGIGPGERVAIVLPNGVPAATAMLGASFAGAACPLDPGGRRAEFDYYFDDLQARTLITDGNLDGPATALARARGMLVLDIAELGRGGRGTPRDVPAGADPALILHTPGTVTALPKMVSLSHANLRAAAQTIAGWLALTPADRCLNVMPLFHIHALVGALLASLAAGASVVCGADFAPVPFFRDLRTLRPTWYTAVPSMHEAIVTRAANEPAPAPLRFVRSSSAALAPQTARDLAALFGAPVIEAYGMTEAAHLGCSNPLDAGRQRFGSVGLAAGCDVIVVDDRGDAVASGTTGEVAIRGASVAQGYTGDPASTARAFAHGWFRTGDLGRFDHDGYLSIEGRIGELIDRDGRRIAPREIEEVLLSHPDVMQAIAFALPDGAGGQGAGAAVVLSPKSRIDEGGLRAFAVQRLAPHMVPQRIVAVEQIPKGPTGKPIRTGLAALLHLERAVAVPPESRRQARDAGFERVLGEIWREVLGCGVIDGQVDFFAAGGDSLRAFAAIARIRERCARELTFAEFCAHRTLGAQVAVLAHAPLTAPREPPPPDDRAPLSLAQRDVWRAASGARGRVSLHVARFAGRLDAARLSAALNACVARHPALRTRFTGSASVDGVRAGVGPAVHLVVPSLDMRELTWTDYAAHERRFIADFVREPFDAERAPLLRAALLRSGNDACALVFAAHALVFDRWSFNVLLRDAAAFYRAALRGAAAELPPLRLTYAQVAANEAAACDASPLTAHAAGMAPFTTERAQWKIPAQLAARFLRAGAARGATPYMTLLAALRAAEPRPVACGEIVAAIPLAGRDRREYEPLVGRFARTAAVTLGAGDSTFDAVLARVRDAVACAAAPDSAFRAASAPDIQLDVAPHEAALPWLPGLTVRAEDRTPAQHGAAVSVTVARESDGALRIVSESSDPAIDRETLESLHARLYAVIETAAASELSRKADAVKKVS